jgi:hypothetical protein
MLQCYVLTCGRSVTAFLAPPRSLRPGQGPRSPHPKAGPAPTYHQRFLNVSWAFRLITCGYEPPVTDAKKRNEQIYQNFRLQVACVTVGTALSSKLPFKSITFPIASKRLHVET